MPTESPWYPIADAEIGELEERYVVDALRSGWVSSIGEYLQRFEAGFAAYCGCTHGISTSNGTTALHLLLRALNIGPGDEVIIPALTFVATANAVSYTGATPVFVDSEPEYWCMDPACVKRAITSRTKAVIAVHLYGHPCAMTQLRSITDRHGILLLEDAAEAHGAHYRGAPVGSLSTAAAFSFYGNKLMTTGEGGMITTSDPELADRARFLRDHAMSKQRRYWHSEVGFNYRMTNIQAALGLAQLARLDNFIARKRQIFKWYTNYLGQVNSFQLSPKAEWADPVYWLTCLVADGLNTAALMKTLRESGVDSRPFFVLLHTLPMYNKCRFVSANESHDSVAENLADSGINLPSSVKLQEADVRDICTHLLCAVHDEQCVA